MQNRFRIPAIVGAVAYDRLDDVPLVFMFNAICAPAHGAA